MVEERGGAPVCEIGLRAGRLSLRELNDVMQACREWTMPTGMLWLRRHPATQGASLAMGTLIDSSVLIAVERGKLDLAALPASLHDDDVGIAAITASELLHGVHRADSEARRSRREAFVEALLQRLPVLPFDLLAARIHARLWAGLRDRGASVGAHDS